MLPFYVREKNNYVLNSPDEEQIMVANLVPSAGRTVYNRRCHFMLELCFHGL